MTDELAWENEKKGKKLAEKKAGKKMVNIVEVMQPAVVQSCCWDKIPDMTGT